MKQENHKVGILTFHRAYNYGAVLQAYALQKAMGKAGIDCELVDYFPEKFRKMYTLHETKNDILFKSGMTACRVAVSRTLKRRNAGFEGFIKQELKRSQRTYRNSEDIQTEEYAGFVTGSDQVWNASLTNGDNVFFLQGGQFSAKKRYSYAASIGKSELSESDGEDLGNKIKNYDLISVRENSAAEIVFSTTGQEAVISCDPTILLEKDKWETICGQKPIVSGDYIFLYYVKSPEYIRRIACKLSQSLSCPVVCVSCTFSKSFISVYKYFGGYQDRKDGFISYNVASPYDFLNLIKNAKYVVTSSFHGAVFSVLFHKPFLAQTMWPDGTKNIRVIELLNRCGLQERSANNWSADINKPIDWENVDNRIAVIRDKGFQYLTLIKKNLCEESVSEEELRSCDLGKLPEEEKPDPAVYAVKHKDEAIRAASRSGGIFTAISDVVLEHGGVVYGCRMTEEFLAEHIRAETKIVRDTMRGSKYVQSFLGDTFTHVKEDLNAGRKVLFTGTSCQVAGLKCYLKKDYQNLICMDIVCHGVPSKVVWKSYLKWLEKKHGKRIVSVDFRNKRDFGWAAHKETITFEDGSRVDSDIYKNLFFGHCILRPSCHECRYKTIHHPGDITIGDYWGIDNAVPGFNDNKGVSLLIINTEAGQRLLEQAKDNVVLAQTTMSKAMQPALFAPFARSVNRAQFWKDYTDMDFGSIAKKYGLSKKSRFGVIKRLYHKVKGRKA